MDFLIKPKSELVSINILRAVASLGVFYYHLHMGKVLASYLHLKLLNTTDAFGETYAVPLFFLVSGYCIHLSNLKYIKAGHPLPIREYFKRRVLRIYPAYFVAILVSLGINSITRYNPPTSLADFLLHLFLLQGFSAPYFNGVNLVLWTISTEFMLYIIYPFFYYLTLKLSLNQALSIVFLISAVSITFFSSKSNIAYPQYYFVFNLWFAWCCGAAVADKNATDTNTLKKSVYKFAYAIIVLLFVCNACLQPAWMYVFSYQLKILIWAAPLVYILNKEDTLKRINSFFIKTVITIGVSSYSLYLFHEPLIALKNFAVHKYLSQQLQTLGVLLGIFIIPVISWLSFKFIEKPFMAKKQKAIT